MTPTADKRRLSVLDHICLNAFWFAFSVLWSSLLVVTIPSQVLNMVGDARKGTGMAWIMGLGAFIALVFPPFVGAISDRARFRMGRRRPFILAGTVINCLALLGMAYFDSFSLYVLAFLFVEFGNNLAMAAYSALIPDIVSHDQRGLASGYMNLMVMLGTIAGVAAAGVLTAKAVVLLYWLLMAVLLVAMLITVFTVEEEPLTEVKPLDLGALLRDLWTDPRDRPDFAWLFLSRLLVMTGRYIVQEFLQYYLKDVIGPPFRVFGTAVASNAEGAVALVVLMIMVGATVSSLIAGALSDRLGRKRLIYLSGGLMVVPGAFLIMSHNFTLVTLLGIAFGLGFGVFASTDWALATDVLPSADDYAKDMGIWHIATVLPRVVAVPVAGPVLDVFNRLGPAWGYPSLGYTVIFSMSMAYVMVGTALVSRIKGAD
jgi:MFS family permease